MDCKNLVLGQRNICHASQNPQLSLIFDLYKASVNLSVYGGFKLSKIRKKAKTNWFFCCVTRDTKMWEKKNMDFYHLHWKLRLLCQIYTMYILRHYFPPENKTDNRDFTKFDIQKLAF